MEILVLVAERVKIKVTFRRAEEDGLQEKTISASCLYVLYKGIHCPEAKKVICVFYFFIPQAKHWPR